MNVVRLLFVHFTIAAAMAGGFAVIQTVWVAAHQLAERRRRYAVKIRAARRLAHLRMLAALDDVQHDRRLLEQGRV